MFEKICMKNKHISIHKRLMIYFVVFALIPTLLVSCVYYNLSSKYINQVTTELGITMINRVCNELEFYFNSITRVGDIAADNQRIQQTLRMDFKNNLASRYSKDLENDAELYFANYLQPDMLGLNVLGDNHSEFKSHNRTFKNQIHTEQDWYKKIRRSQGYVWFPPHVGQFAVISAGEVVISCGRRIIDKASGKATGIVLIDVREDAVKEIISTKLGKSGYLLILDENNNLIYSPVGFSGSLENLPMLISDKTEGSLVTNIRIEKKQAIVDEKVIATYKEMPTTGWKVIGVIPIRSLNKVNEILPLLTVFIIIFILGVAFFEASKISKELTNPLRNLMCAMKKVENGDLSINIHAGGYEEVAELTSSFNLMVNKIQTLMKNVYDKQKKLRKAELKALQAQINPHFLYNTFDSILWLNRDGKRDEVEILVESLTTLFRIGISKGKDIITLREELEHVDSYLKIQAIRYDNIFDYLIDVEDSLLDYQVPKLMLQPLVENAIYHGVKLKKSKGTIKIEAEDKGETWEIYVSDTGKGMPKEKLKQLNNYLMGEKNTQIKVYGVENVDERIKMIYGKEYGLFYESKEDIGTKVTVILDKFIHIQE